jgi:hypothetical protein
VYAARASFLYKGAHFSWLGLYGPVEAIAIISGSLIGTIQPNSNLQHSNALIIPDLYQFVYEVRFNIIYISPVDLTDVVLVQLELAIKKVSLMVLYCCHYCCLKLSFMFSLVIKYIAATLSLFGTFNSIHLKHIKTQTTYYKTNSSTPGFYFEVLRVLTKCLTEDLHQKYITAN